MTEIAMKKTGGRRRIPIQKIENKVKRSVAFSKRKAGLFKKASELATLCGSEIAVLVFSDAGKAFTFGRPSADSVVQRYFRGSNPSHSTAQSCNLRNSIYAQLGCDNSIDRMGLDELILYSKYLQNLQNIVAAKATSMDCCSSPHASDQLFVQENSAEMHSRYLEELKSLDVERAIGDCQLSDCFNWMEAESSKYMLYGDQGMMKDRYEQQAVDVVVSPTTTSTNDFYNVQENSVDDVQLGDLSNCFNWMDAEPSKYMLYGDQGMMMDGYEQQAVDVVVSPTTSSNDFYNVQENSVDDVQLGDLDNLDLSKPLEELINFNVFDSPMNFVGEGKMNDGYEQQTTTTNDFYNVQENSSSYADVDAQWGNSLCDIQWEEDLDFLASFLHH